MGRPWEGCQHLITIKTLRSGGRRPGAGRPPGSKSRPTREFLASLHKTEWVVYAKKPFGGPQPVLA
jgi:hypothetical protein